MPVPRHLARSPSWCLWKEPAVWIRARFWYRIVCRDSSPGQIFSLCAHLERGSPCVPVKKAGDRIVRRRQGFSGLFKTFMGSLLSLMFGEARRTQRSMFACLKGNWLQTTKWLRAPRSDKRERTMGIKKWSVTDTAGDLCTPPLTNRQNFFAELFDLPLRFLRHQSDSTSILIGR